MQRVIKPKRNGRNVLNISEKKDNEKGDIYDIYYYGVLKKEASCLHFSE